MQALFKRDDYPDESIFSAFISQQLSRAHDLIWGIMAVIISDNDW